MRKFMFLLPVMICVLSCLQVKIKSDDKKYIKISQELHNFLSQKSQSDEFSGVVLLANNNNIIFQNAYGEANKDFKVKNNLETKFNLGSITKMFTTNAIAQLLEQNKLSFDDKLSKFMPDFPDRLSAKKIQISHLLAHTSGLGHYMNDEFWASSKLLFKTLDENLVLAKCEKLAFEPGTSYQYSNTGYLILGKIIEIVSKENYFDYIKNNIFIPSNMADSGFFDLSLVNYNLAIGYEKILTDSSYYFKNNLFDYLVKGGPGGGSYSTVRDLLNFSLALRQGKLISLETLEKMTSPELDTNYGYGMKVDFSNEDKIIGHGGGFIGISTRLSIYLKSGFIIIILGNYGQSSAEPVELKMKELINQ